jgi:hypothetical protein
MDQCKPEGSKAKHDGPSDEIKDDGFGTFKPTYRNMIGITTTAPQAKRTKTIAPNVKQSEIALS